MPRWTLWLLAVALVVVGVVMLRKDILAALTRSGAAARLGLSNEPDRPDDRARLLWLHGRVTEVLRIIRQRWAGATMTSAYRSDDVNKAVDGSPTSRHRLALAFDVGGIDDYEAAARYLREHARGLAVQPKSVIAEAAPPHLHIEYFDPLGKIDPPGTRAKTVWRRELPGRVPGQQRQLEALA